jgi:3-oxoacyl-[acyl-carrier protein] reductase
MVFSKTRTAIVTGAAHGIGAGIATRLAQEGVRVAAIDLDGTALTETVDAIKAKGGKAWAIVADVADPEAVREAVDETSTRIGPPTIVVNNAGLARDVGLARMSLEDWDIVHGVHLRGSFLVAQGALPFMTEAKWGRIIQISSISAQGHADRSNYCAAKAGTHGFVKSLAVELGPLGITANAVAPGLVVTRMTDATAARRGLSLEDHLADAVQRIPVRRAGKPEDVAAMVAFLAGEEAGFVSGQVVYVAGGPHD